MAQVWFCSDLHFGHENIDKFRLHVKSEKDNRQRIIDDWKDLVGKRDIVYVLGDAAFSMETIQDFSELPGIKYLVRGNHDLLNTSAYLKVFKEVYGLRKYKEFWLSHAPIHPEELLGRVNLHGHVHYNSIRKEDGTLDPQYFNCCVENLVFLTGRSLISLDNIRDFQELCTLRLPT